MGFRENLDSIRQRIAAACARAGRDPVAVTLLAVSKTHPPETIQTAVDCGQIFFGENKIQEAKAKIPLCPGKARWQFIGHLQSNKARDAVELFEMIQGVDSLSIAHGNFQTRGAGGQDDADLARSERGGRRQQVRLPTGQLLAELNALNALPKIEIHGLMAIPPFTPAPEKARPYFQRLRELKVAVRTNPRRAPAAFEHGHER